jgi:MarR family transcriptional regulator, 2-MHQ and catechol-resistance regulon repressor
MVSAKAHRALSARVEESIERHGLCLSDFMTLEVLLHKGPLTIGEIGARVLLASGSTTAAIDRLAKRGLVRRRFTKKDRRARVIHLTPGGEQLAKEVFEAHARDLEELMGVLDKKERGELYNLLKKVGLAAAAAAATAPKVLSTKERKNNAADQEK